VSEKQMTSGQFLKDVESHAITIKQNDGLYRHLSFRQPGPHSWNMWFDLVTWPGNLVIRGGMGTWAFSRVDDMFRFFRSSEELKINPHYWMEKIDAESRFGGPSMRFSPDKFKVAVLERLEGCELRADTSDKIKAELEDEVFGIEDESEARRALRDFEHYHLPDPSAIPCKKFTFTDTWEIKAQGYTYHYLWCCYAIVWGIQQYDAAQVELAKMLPVVEV
jgi:hypothetical protein